MKYYNTGRQLFRYGMVGLLSNKRWIVHYVFLTGINQILGIGTRLTWVMDYPPLEGNPTQRLVQLCQAAGATHYLSGPAAKNYLDEEEFQRAGIMLEYMDYSGYPEYPQLYPPFTHNVSILDLIFSCGPDAANYIWKPAIN